MYVIYKLLLFLFYQEVSFIYIVYSPKSQNEISVTNCEEFVYQLKRDACINVCSIIDTTFRQYYYEFPT